MSLKKRLDEVKDATCGGSLNKLLGTLDVTHSAYYAWLRNGQVSPKKAIEIENLCAAHGVEVKAVDLCSPAN